MTAQRSRSRRLTRGEKAERRRARIEAAALQLPARERAEFLRLLSEAEHLIAQGWNLRRAAWALPATFKAQEPTS
ncbi:MAG: hypothetical protein IT483_15745 [Gammaproteobacteria bacterium]|nr:hypothetical protein [Gammaproteobacteria bacterium]